MILRKSTPNTYPFRENRTPEYELYDSSKDSFQANAIFSLLLTETDKMSTGGIHIFRVIYAEENNRNLSVDMTRFLGRKG
jgi:hypothetical protein